MNTVFLWFLLALFAVHLAAFAVLGLKRRQWYYLALVATFALLTGAFGVRLFAPEATAMGLPLHQLLRYCAWAAAAVSISWTATRIIARSRGAG